MEKNTLSFDPFNLIITGVGGQGNVMASRVLGNMLSQKGFHITIGETFGASQRGGSVMSHIRVSSTTSLSPQIARGQAHMIVALEPIEAVRVLMTYGNPDVNVLCNVRPIHPVGVISGELDYPAIEESKAQVTELSGNAWFINATDTAMEKMGNPIFGNIILLGALAGTDLLPLDRDDFKMIIQGDMTQEKVDVNMDAYDMGMEMVGKG